MSSLPWLECDNMAEETIYTVSILLDGYAHTDSENRYRADGTCSLITGNHMNILVDTGSPKDKDRLLQKLGEHHIVPEDVNYVICTHGHIDHVGNLNLFTSAVQIVSHDILLENDIYGELPNGFNEGEPYKIDGDKIQVISTPGHTFSDVSVVVRATDYGTVVICGDLFEHENDEHVWEEFSECPEKHRQSRKKVLEVGNWIIPGHGKMFRVKKT